MFFVGQKIVCVDDVWPRDNKANWPHIQFPVRGQEYTVAWIGENPAYPGISSIRLFELSGVSPNSDFEMSYRPTRFRPVIERKTDISIFVKLLTPSPKQKVRA